jgi:hypothetical protein
MKRIFTVLTIVFSFAIQAQSIDMVTINPQIPFACNSFDVEVSGWKPMPQFFIVNHTINVTSNFINIVINWDAPPIGNPMLAPYTYTVSVPANSAPAGMWGVVVTNYFIGAGQNTASNTSTVILQSCCSAVADFSISQSTLCYNDTLYVTDASTGYSNLTWYLNGTPLGATPGDFQIYGLPAGSYTLVQVADTSGCSTSDTSTFSFGYEPDHAFTHVQIGNGFTFSASGSSVYNYTWDFGDGSTGQGAFATHNYAVDGQYQVCLTSTSAAGCVADSCITVTYSTVGIADAKSKELSVFPNPAKESVTIRNAIAQPKMYDVIGRECAVRFTRNGNDWMAKISHLPKGMYLVQTDNKVLKLVID